MSVNDHRTFFNDSLGESDGRRDHRVQRGIKGTYTKYVPNAREEFSTGNPRSRVSLRAFCRRVRALASNNQH
jgi:hypothetical protein